VCNCSLLRLNIIFSLFIFGFLNLGSVLTVLYLTARLNNNFIAQICSLDLFNLLYFLFDVSFCILLMLSVTLFFNLLPNAAETDDFLGGGKRHFLAATNFICFPL
jgi:hypothetical protein